jgi:prepilin-type N-terminal cleavage/methylation domain-containing protein
VNRRSGFTLLELLVVCAIVGGTLILVPVYFGSFGARSRLSSAANSMLSKLAAVKEQAMNDGYESRLEIGTYRERDGTRRVGTRFWFTNLPAKGTSKLLEEDSDKQRERVTSRAQDRQWMVSEWHAIPEGVVVPGVSIEAGQWEKLGEGDRSFQVRYFADGSVERAVAIRLESEDLEVKSEYRTVTVMVNALSSEAASYEGFKELPRHRDASEFR